MDIRPSPIAGTWYPGDAETLTHDIDRYLSQAHSQSPTGKVWGVIAPHAGYRYSGPVAAHAFNCMRGLRPSLAVVVSPFHSGHRAPLLTTGHEAYSTPLGTIEVDAQATRQLDHALRNRLGIGLTPLYQDTEHALEIELPFLQRVLGTFTLLPVMIANQTTSVIQGLGEALADTLRERQGLLVASSDLSHFYPQTIAQTLDAEMLRRVASFDPKAVMEAEDEGAGFACGRSAIAAVLWAARRLGADRVTVLHHATSGDVTGDFESVVGYGAAVIWQSPN